MKVEYVPTAEDHLELRRLMHARLMRHPALLMVLTGCVLLTLGGALMAGVGSSLWAGLSIAGFMFAGTLWYSFNRLAPTPAKVEEEFGARAWLNSAFRIEADATGVTYDHGPFHARLAWRAFASVAETKNALMLLETPSPGALVYGLAKRELEKTSGGAAAWRQFLRHSIRTSSRH